MILKTPDCDWLFMPAYPPRSNGTLRHRNALALRYHFTSIRLSKVSKGLLPSSCRTCSAHLKKQAFPPRECLQTDVQFCALDPEPDPASVDVPASAGGVIASGLGVGLGKGTGDGRGVGTTTGAGVGTGVEFEVITDGSDEEAVEEGVLAGA